LDTDEILRDIEVPFDTTKKNWEDKYKSKAESTFDNFSQEEIDRIESLTGKDFDNLPDNSEDSILLYILYRFSKDYEEVIEQFAERKGYRMGGDEHYLIILKKLDEGYTKIAYHIFFYGLWLDNRHRRRYKVVEGEIPRNYPEKLTNQDRSFKQSLSRNTRSSNFRMGEDRTIDFIESNLFCIDRQTTDKEKRDVRGRQRRRNLGTVFFEITKNEGIVEFRVGPKSIRDILIEKIEQHLEINLQPMDIVKGDIDAEKFEEAFTTYEENDEWMITNIDLKKVRDQPSVPVTVSKKTAGKDIRPLIASWNNDVFNLSIPNVNRFWLQWNEVEARINVKDIGDNSTMLDSDIKTPKTNVEDTVREEFSEKFGVPLDYELLEHQVTGDREKLVKYILSDLPEYEVSRLDKGLIKELEEKGLVKVVQYEDNEPDEELEHYQKGIKRIKLLKAGVKDYFIDKAQSAGLNYQEDHSEQIYGKKYDFERFEYEGRTIDFSLPKYNSFTDSSRKYLRNSINPIMIVNIGSVHDKALESRFSSRIDLPKLVTKDVENENPEDYIMEKTEQIARGSEQRVAEEAEEAFNNIKEILREDREEGTQFELDIFPIFKQLIPSASRWGAKRRGNQPDGFGELVFQKSQGHAYRSIAYDSKFTSKDELKFDSDDSRQARDYVYRIEESKQVEKNKTKFRNYLIITNKKESGNFGSTIAGSINRMRNWDGVPVLLHIEFLLTLYEVYNKENGYLKTYKNEFYKHLYKKINGDRYQKYNDRDDDFFVELDGQDAIDLLEDMKEEVGDGTLDIDELREFLERDIF
jgi:hypothetical protein